MSLFTVGAQVVCEALDLVVATHDVARAGRKIVMHL
jgi:hypothetical protein